MKTRHWLLSAGIPIVALLAFALLRSPGDSSSARRSGDAAAVSSSPESAGLQNPSVRDSESDIEALQVQLQSLRAELTALKGRDVSRAPAEIVEPESTVEEQRQREVERTHRTSAFLETNLQRQARDPGWALAAEQQVSTTFNGEEVAAGSELQQLSCQSSMCRIDSHHVDAEAERTFMTRLGRLEAFGDAEAFSQRNEHPDGSVEIVTYVSRSGYRLPPMD